MAVDVLARREERKGNNTVEYPFEYFDAQVRFARRWAELTGVSLAGVIRTKTAITHRLLDKPESEAWQQVMREAESNPEAASELIYGRYLSQPVSKYVPPPDHSSVFARFGFFNFEYFSKYPLNEGRNTIRVHFANSPRGEKSALAPEFLSQRRKDLKGMFDFIKENLPKAQEVMGGSWLYNLPAYLESFPPEFTKDMKRLVPIGFEAQFPDSVAKLPLTEDSVWGQFVDRRGWVRKGTYDAFVKSVQAAQTTRDLVDAFPNTTLQPKASIEVFHNWKPTT